MKKEELIAENARLRSELAEVEKDFSNFGNVARKNLAVTLGLATHKQSLYGDKEESLPEWSEIYARIGELRTIERQRDESEKLNRIEQDLYRHLEEVNQIEHE